MTKGPGFIRGDARIIGFSVAVPGDKIYIPLDHAQGNNFHNPTLAIAWLKDLLSHDMPKVFHNAMYDIEVLDSISITPNGQWRCTMVNESLIDENALSYSLDNTAKRRVGSCKDEAKLKEAAQIFGVNAKSGMWQLPPEYVGEYAEQDAALLLPILEVQEKIIANEELHRVYKLESDLLKVVWAMRKKGVKVDVEQAEMLKKIWSMELKKHFKSIKKQAGYDLDIWSPTALADYCTKNGYEFNETEKGNPSFDNSWLESQNQPIFKTIARARKLNKMVRDFLDGLIGEYHIKGRLHAQFHTTKRDDKGTRSGRFSSSNPNLQQVPARDPEFGPAIRRLFVPDDGAEWGKFDFSSQEPRITVHFAAKHDCRGAADVATKFQKDRYFDLHTFASKLVQTDRRSAKGIGLGITYGMGLDKLALELRVNVLEAKRRKDAYNQALPFISAIAKIYTSLAERQGFVCTHTGRRSRFEDPRFAYKALNRAVQGIGADMIKQAMVDIWDKHEVCPLLTVHDENNFNIYDRDFVQELTSIMENAIPLSVPNLVDPEVGPNWSEVMPC